MDMHVTYVGFVSCRAGCIQTTCMDAASACLHHMHGDEHRPVIYVIILACRICGGIIIIAPGTCLNERAMIRSGPLIAVRVYAMRGS